MPRPPSKTQLLYSKIKVGSYVFIIKDDMFMECPSLIRTRVNKKYYAHGNSIALGSPNRYHYIPGATKKLFTNKKDAEEAFIRRLKYWRKLQVANINRLNKQVVISEERIKKLDKKIRKYSK